MHGVHGEVLEPTNAARGESSSRRVIGEFSFNAQAVIVTSGGIGGNHELVRRYWPVDRLGAAPERMLSGVPQHVDGLLQTAVAEAGARLINPDRMWHYTEGVHNWNPIWPAHGIRILPGPSSLWLDPTGRRLPFPNIPGADTLRNASAHHDKRLRAHVVRAQPRDHQARVRALGQRAESGSHGEEPAAHVEAFGQGSRQRRFRHSWIAALISSSARTLRELADGMNAVIGDQRVDYASVEREVRDRDSQISNRAGKDPQLAIIRNARRILSERLVRVATAGAHSRSSRRSARRRATEHSDAKIARRPRDRPRGAGDRGRRPADAGAVRSRRGCRVRRRRCARLSRARRNVSGWLHFQRADRRAVSGGRGVRAQVTHFVTILRAVGVRCFRNAALRHPLKRALRPDMTDL